MVGLHKIIGQREKTKDYNNCSCMRIKKTTNVFRDCANVIILNLR